MSRRPFRHSVHADPTGHTAANANVNADDSASDYSLPRRFVGMVASRINEFRNAPEKLSLDDMIAEAEAEAPNFVDKAVVRRALLSSPGINGLSPLMMCLQIASEEKERGESTKYFNNLALQLMEGGADVCAAGAVDQRSGFGGIVMTAVLVRDVSVLQAVLSAGNVGLSGVNAKGLPCSQLFRRLRSGDRCSSVTSLEAACLLGEDLLVGCLLDAGASVADFTFAFAGCLTTPSAVSRLLGIKEGIKGGIKFPCDAHFPPDGGKAHFERTFFLIR